MKDLLKKEKNGKNGGHQERLNLRGWLVIEDVGTKNVKDASNCNVEDVYVANSEGRNQNAKEDEHEKIKMVEKRTNQEDLDSNPTNEKINRDDDHHRINISISKIELYDNYDVLISKVEPEPKNAI